MKRIVPIAPALVLAFLVGGCATSSADGAPTSTTIDPSAAARASASASEAARQAEIDAAIEGYHRARKVVAAMTADPRSSVAEYPASLDIAHTLTGDALTKTVLGATQLKAAGVRAITEMAGSTPVVVSTDLTKHVVVLSHCAADETTRIMKGNQELPQVLAKGEAAPPWRDTYTMVKQGDAWLLSHVQGDSSRTCTRD